MTTIEYKGQNLDAAKLHTKQLLRMLRDVSQDGYCECCYDPDFVRESYRVREAVRPIVKAELAKREHIPNKQEAKRIRQEKARTQKNLKNKKYVNAR